MLANYADESNSTFPSYKTLAALCECNERSVIRAIKVLYDDGMIDVENRFTDSGKQTSNRFILLIPRGDKLDTDRVTNYTPNTITINRDGNKAMRGDKYAQGFLEWWDLYPRNDGSKAKAYEIWKRVVERFIDAKDLYSATEKFKKACIGKDKKYIPHATTWLNQKRWETVEEESKATSKNHLAG